MHIERNDGGTTPPVEVLGSTSPVVFSKEDVDEARADSATQRARKDRERRGIWFEDNSPYGNSPL